MKLENPLEDPDIIVLENEPSDPTKRFHYKAILVRKHSDKEKPYERGFDGAWILKIVGIYDNGPDITPGQWYLDTLLGYDDYGSGKISDFIYIDAGQHWGVGNMIAVLKEAEEIAYGKMDESLNEGAVKDLMLRGPEREDFLNWAWDEIYLSSGDSSEAIRLYCQENDLTPSELQTLATLYMEGDDDPEELEVWSYLVSNIIEGKRDGELDESFVDKYAHIPYHLRNWYQKPENQSGYEEPKKAPKKKKPTKKAIEQMENLEGEIQDLRYYLKGLQSDNRNRHNESEEYSAEIIQNYGFDILDLLNSGLSKEDKIQAMKEWNMKQDEKSKEIRNPERMVQEHDYYYGEEKDKEEEELQQQIDQKEEELSKLEY